MKKKKKIPKIRNRIAISAWNRPGAGQHKDKSKYDRKKHKKILERDSE